MAEEPDLPEVRPPTVEDLRRICRALDENGAGYVLIGGFAVILHGSERTTKDIDFLVDPDPANVDRLKRTVRPSDAADRAWLDALRDEGRRARPPVVATGRSSRVPRGNR